MLFAFQEFCLSHKTIEPSQYMDHETPRRRLLSEADTSFATADPAACSVDDVLQLLQLLYAVANDSSVDNNANGMIYTRFFVFNPMNDTLYEFTIHVVLIMTLYLYVYRRGVSWIVKYSSGGVFQ